MNTKLYAFFIYNLHTGDRACTAICNCPFKPYNPYYYKEKYIKYGWVELKQDLNLRGISHLIQVRLKN